MNKAGESAKKRKPIKSIMKALTDRHNNFSEKNNSKCIVAVQEVNSIFLFYLNLAVYGQSQIRISWKRRLFDMLYRTVTPIVT